MAVRAWSCQKMKNVFLASFRPRATAAAAADAAVLCKPVTPRFFYTKIIYTQLKDIISVNLNIGKFPKTFFSN